jgi:hypothetical protein
MNLTRDQILESSDLKKESVDVPEWGGTVTVRTMTGTDRDAFESSLYPAGPDGVRKSDPSNMREKLVAMTVVDDAGNRIFTGDDISAIGRKSSAAIERVFLVAQRLNGIGPAAAEVAVKNSDASPSEGSTSV